MKGGYTRGAGDATGAWKRSQLLYEQRYVSCMTYDTIFGGGIA
jgi:hypothetical protein